MTDLAIAGRQSGLRYGPLAGALAALLVATVPACWAAGHLYGVDKASASLVLWSVFVFVYFTILILPWLDLRDQEHFTTERRLERMCISWLYLTIAVHLAWELPWVVFFKAIMAGKGQMWAYAWWSYMEGGDMRYATRDVYVLTLETAASIIGVIGAYFLWQYHATRKFTSAQLMTIMILMIADFYATYVYFMSEIFGGFKNVGSVGDLIIKFILANTLWTIMPFVVFVWAARQLAGQRRV
jgi:hypothetical protein